MKTNGDFYPIFKAAPEYVGGDTYFGASARSLIHYPMAHIAFGRIKKKDGRCYNPDDILTTPLIAAGGLAGRIETAVEGAWYHG